MPPCTPASTGRACGALLVCLFAELRGRVAAKCAQEVNLAERRPVGVTEVQLRADALPQQEVGNTLLAARADDEVRIGLPGCVEVAGDVLRRQGPGPLRERAAGIGLLA